jgi:YidC/Oxa1 family membrane protein insertase
MFQTLLIQPLYNILLGLYAITPGHDFGIAIIVFTLIVRIVLWPLIRKQLHSQRALQKLAPDIAKVKEKAKGDRQKESQLLLELYKERGISPFASLLPLLIQLPILFSLFFVLRDALKVDNITHLGYGWLHHLSYIQTILNNHALYHTTFFGLSLLTSSIALAVTAGAAQFFQSKQIMPKAVAGDSASQIASTSLYIIPVMTFLFALSLPAALALYWTTTSVIAMVQQTIILRQDVDEMEHETK